MSSCGLLRTKKVRKQHETAETKLPTPRVYLRIPCPPRGRKLEVDALPLQNRVRLDAVDVPAQRGKASPQRTIDAIKGYPHPWIGGERASVRASRRKWRSRTL